jgi:hypothetical protein
VREADVGDGYVADHWDTRGLTIHSFSTVRPVKKLDAAGSQRASSEFMGSVRRAVEPFSPPRSHDSAQAKAGKALVDGVVTPSLTKVGFIFGNCLGVNNV